MPARWVNWAVADKLRLFAAERVERLVDRIIRFLPRIQEDQSSRVWQLVVGSGFRCPLVGVSIDGRRRIGGQFAAMAKNVTHHCGDCDQQPTERNQQPDEHPTHESYQPAGYQRVWQSPSSRGLSRAAAEDAGGRKACHILEGRQSIGSGYLFVFQIFGKSPPNAVRWRLLSLFSSGEVRSRE